MATTKRDRHPASTSSRRERRAPAASRTRKAGTEMLDSAAADINDARDVDAASRLLLAAGVRDATQAEDIEMMAGRVGALSQVVAAAGARDLAQGADLLEAATDVETISAIVGMM